MIRSCDCDESSLGRLKWDLFGEMGLRSDTLLGRTPSRHDAASSDDVCLGFCFSLPPPLDIPSTSATERIPLPWGGGGVHARSLTFFGSGNMVFWRRIAQSKLKQASHLIERCCPQAPRGFSPHCTAPVTLAKSSSLMVMGRRDNLGFYSDVRFFAAPVQVNCGTNLNLLILFWSFFSDVHIFVRLEGFITNIRCWAAASCSYGRGLFGVRRISHTLFSTSMGAWKIVMSVCQLLFSVGSGSAENCFWGNWRHQEYFVFCVCIVIDGFLWIFFELLMKIFTFNLLCRGVLIAFAIGLANADMILGQAEGGREGKEQSPHKWAN